MGILGTGANVFSDGLILGEIIITALVIVGVRLIRRDRVHLHRRVMLTALGLNLVFLATFLIQDLVRTSHVVERGLTTPLWVFVPLLTVHLTIAVSSLVVAVWAWRIARRGTVRDGQGRVVSVTPQVRVEHRRVSKYYPWLWYATLATGLLLYAALYVFPAS